MHSIFFLQHLEHEALQILMWCEPKIVPTCLLKLKNYENFRNCARLISQKDKKSDVFKFRFEST